MSDLSATDRSGQGALYAPTVLLDAASEGGVPHAGFFGPFWEGKRLSSEIVLLYGALVSVLCLSINPAAIAWFVISTVVNPVYGVSVRPSAHVRDERLERGPLWADRYAPSAVVLEIWSTLVLAPPMHILPDIVFWRAGSAVRRESGSRDFDSETSARFHETADKRVATKYLSCPALALACPRRKTECICAIARKYDEATEPPSDKLVSFHKAIITSSGVANVG